MFLFGLFLACVGEINTVEETTVEVVEEQCAGLDGYLVCDFDAIDEEGNEVWLSGLKGKPVILDFSTMWCGPCNTAAGEVQELQNTYPELIYLTVLIEDYIGETPEADDLQTWETTHEINTAPVWGGSRELITNSPIEATDKLYLAGWPTFYFLDDELRIVGYQRGFDPTAVETWATILTQ